jgi:hypothetical protein
MKKIERIRHASLNHTMDVRLIEKINELVDEVNRINEVLTTNLLSKKDYSNISPYDASRGGFKPRKKMK